MQCNALLHQCLDLIGCWLRPILWPTLWATGAWLRCNRWSRKNWSFHHGGQTFCGVSVGISDWICPVSNKFLPDSSHLGMITIMPEFLSIGTSLSACTFFPNAFPMVSNHVALVHIPHQYCKINISHIVANANIYLLLIFTTYDHYPPPPPSTLHTSYPTRMSESNEQLPKEKPLYRVWDDPKIMHYHAFL